MNRLHHYPTHTDSLPFHVLFPAWGWPGFWPGLLALLFPFQETTP